MTQTTLLPKNVTNYDVKLAIGKLQNSFQAIYVYDYLNTYTITN